MRLTLIQSCSCMHECTHTYTCNRVHSCGGQGMTLGRLNIGWIALSLSVLLTQDRAPHWSWNLPLTTQQVLAILLSYTCNRVGTAGANSQSSFYMDSGDWAPVLMCGKHPYPDSHLSSPGSIILITIPVPIPELNALARKLGLSILLSFQAESPHYMERASKTGGIQTPRHPLWQPSQTAIWLDPDCDEEEEYGMQRRENL